MAQSLSRIMEQINRLQREAATIQNDVVARIRKEITKYGLTAEHLFGDAPVADSTKTKPKSKASSKAARPVKFADEMGNTWHGAGKRPDWLRQALETGKALEDFLVGKVKGKSKQVKIGKAAAEKAEAKPAPVKKTRAKNTPAKKTAAAHIEPAAVKKAAAPKRAVAKEKAATPKKVAPKKAASRKAAPIKTVANSAPAEASVAS